MSAPDFYYVNNAIFRHLHDRHGHETLVRYWRELGSQYYRSRSAKWVTGGPSAIASDWREYFLHEPHADVHVSSDANQSVLDIRVCPAIKHLRDNDRDIVPYFCEHCDHVCGTMAQAAGFSFHRLGGMGSCRQTFVKLTIEQKG